MPTTSQLIKKKRKKPTRRSKSRDLCECPQKRGVVNHITVKKPKKPNSANRVIVKLKLTNGRSITAYVPGERMARHLQIHTPVLIRGGKRPDLPGVKYVAIPAPPFQPEGA